MIDHCAYEERLAIRQFCGNMTEREAIRLTDAEAPSLAQRISALAAHQRAHAKPIPLTMPVRDPILTAKDMAAGEVE